MDLNRLRLYDGTGVSVPLPLIIFIVRPQRHATNTQSCSNVNATISKLQRCYNAASSLSYSVPWMLYQKLCCKVKVTMSNSQRPYNVDTTTSNSQRWIVNLPHIIEAVTVMSIQCCNLNVTCKVAHKCLNVRERVEVVEWNRKRSPPFPYSPVSCQCPWKKALIEKKKKKKKNVKCGLFMIAW